MRKSSALNGPRKRHLGSIRTPSGALAATLLSLLSLGALVEFSTQDPGLQAENRDVTRVDTDGDGITDEQELVLGTSPDHVDTDGDTFSDLEELSRRSDPLDSLSLPGADALGLGMYAHAEDNAVVLSTAMFVEDGALGGLNFDIGVVIDGQPVVLTTATYSGSTRAYFYVPDSDPTNRIVVLEMRIPEVLVRSMGGFDLFSRVSDVSPLGRATQVDVTELVDFSGVTMRRETAPSSMQRGGVIYRPLAGDGSIPATWSSGQICHQTTTPVGMNGASVVHEVEDAGCEDFDTYCGGADCAATAGQPIERPDPGVLLGG
jgi:hypothetical protein